MSRIAPMALAALCSCAADVESLEIRFDRDETIVGLTVQATVVATYDDGKTEPLDRVDWATSEPGLASVDEAGVVTPLAAGVVRIEAREPDSGLEAQALLRVLAATLTAVRVTPADPSVAAGLDVQLSARGDYDNGTTEDLTASATWTAVDAAIATVTGGLVHGVAPGTTTVAAAFGGLAGTVEVTVTDAEVVSVTVGPESAVVAIGRDVALSAAAVLTTGLSVDVTTTVDWSSSNHVVASVDAAGSAHGESVGTVTITATHPTSGVSGTTSLEVVDADLESLAIVPTGGSVPAGLALELTAEGTFSDGGVQDLTAQVSWSSSDTGVARVTAGVVTAVTPGIANILAIDDLTSISDQVEVTVTDAVLESLSVAPATLVLPDGRALGLAAEGTYSDDSAQDLTPLVQWRSSDNGVASVDGAGLVEALSIGDATITAEHLATGETGFCDVEVTAAVIDQIDLTPASLSLAKGRTLALTATAIYSDGSAPDVTSSASWGTTDPAVVTVDASGLIDATGVGDAEVEATLDGVTGRANVMVTSAEVDSFVLVPASLTLPRGRTGSFEARATLSDGATLDITTLVSWESDDETVATVAAGVVTAEDLGNATVTATHAASGLDRNGAVTVIAAELDHIDVDPQNALVGFDYLESYTATGVYSDDSTQDLTTGVDWDTVDTGVATIDASGVLRGTGLGDTSVTATHMATSIVGSADVTVAYIAEGSASAPVTITAPHVGQVDTTRSYYVASGLTPGLIYTVSIDGNDDVDLFVYDDLFTTRVCSSSTFTGQEDCDATTPASGSLYIEVRGFAATTNPGALFTITLSAGAPRPDLIIVLTGVNGNGSLITFDYTITNNGLGTVDLFGVTLSFWADAASAPAVTDMGPHPAFGPSATLGPGQSHSATTPLSASSVTSGTAYANIDYNEAVLESDDDNNVSPAFVW